VSYVITVEIMKEMRGIKGKEIPLITNTDNMIRY